MKTYFLELLDRIEQRLDKNEAKFESKIDSLEKSIWDLIRDREEMNRIVKKLYSDAEEQKKPRLLFIKENEGVVRIILVVMAIATGMVSVSRDVLVEFIKRNLGIM